MAQRRLRNGAWNGVRWNHRGDWWRHRPFFGWAGPVFWPWFYDDFFYYTFWDYGPYYDAPFWAYGYGDIYGAMFSPYGYDGLAGWAPPRAARTRTAVARGNAPTQRRSQPQPAEPVERHVRRRRPGRQPADRPHHRGGLRPTSSSAPRSTRSPTRRVQAAQTIKTACPTDVAYTPTGRLDAMERRVQAMVQAVAHDPPAARHVLRPA